MGDPGDESENFFDLLGQGTPLSQIPRQVFTGLGNVGEYAADVARDLALHPSHVRLPPEFIQMGFWSLRRRQEDIHLVNDNLAPRLSLAWDPWADGKTKFAIAAGRYFDKIFLAVPLVEVEPFEARDSFTTEARVDSTGVITFARPSSDISLSPLTARLIDRDLKTPYQDELALTFEHEIFPETAIQANYIRRRFRDQLQDVDVNHAPGDHGRCVTESVLLPDGGSLLQGAVEPSPGTGPVPDPISGQPYDDTDPGRGDGVVDDCLGDLQFFGPDGALDPPTDLADGRPDLYVQNPGWEEMLLLGNFNASDYEAVVLQWIRRMYRNWELQASYTWSEASGNAEDFNLLLGNEATLREDERGYLDYDQRHVFKLDATGLVGSFRFGGALTWQSGLPYSLIAPQTVGFNVPPEYPFQRTTALRSRLRYPTGQRNDQRNASWFNLDLRIARNFRLGGDRWLELSVDLFNALNDDTLQIESVTTNVRRNTPLGESVAAPDQIAGTRHFGRRWQVGLRLGF
jgi:hypothetical protein